MKRIISIISYLLLCINILNATGTAKETVSDSICINQEKIYTAVDEQPKFIDGDGALYKWLSENIRYPEAAVQNNIQGRVTTQFIVEKDGSIGEVKIVRGKNPELDAEAIRVIKSLPRFIPGKMNGQAVRVWYTLPVNFKIKQNNPN